MITVAEAPADLEEPAIVLPTEPVEEPARGFPVLMTVAPVVVALVLFAILRTPYVLMFAVLGPVLGIANVIDQRVGRKRRLRRARAAFAENLAESRRAVTAAHRRILGRKRAARPLARDLVRGERRIEPGIVVGVTTVLSGLRVEGGGDSAELTKLARDARRLDNVPHAVDTVHVAVTGPRAEVTGAVRALLVQLLADDLARSVAVVGELAETVRQELTRSGIRLSAPEHASVRILAGQIVGVQPATFQPANSDEKDSAQSDSAVSRSAHPVHIDIAANGEAVLTEQDGNRVLIRVDSLGAAQLAQWLPAVRQAQMQRQREAALIPDRCDLAELESAPARGLAARFLVGPGTGMTLDLVADGPHAVIGGTTGSGKSELLIAWVTALAVAHTSSECNVLCIDFKGGATFDAVADLPHCVGVVTDLDGGEALRVVASLRAEVRRREQRLREFGVRDVADLERGQLPRLVVLVDEYQALIEEHPELQETFGDIGARGRSLGIHLILCTQRPTGTFKENLLANCAIRLSLRVEQASDSLTLLGVSAGANLAREKRGRALLRVGSDDVKEVQVALARPEFIGQLRARECERRTTRGLGMVRRPWHPPLPTSLGIDDLLSETPPTSGSTTSGAARENTSIQTAPRVPFARADVPAEQSQFAVALAKPGEHLFVIGMSGSGKSGTVRAIAESAAASGVNTLMVGPSVEDAWDTVARVLRPVDSIQQRDAMRVALIDDIDLLEQRFGDEHRAEWLERVQRLLRSGTELGVTVVITARRVTGTLQRIQGLCSNTLRFAAPSRQDWVLQGGESADWSERMLPGRGRLGRTLVQVAHASNCGAQNFGAQNFGAENFGAENFVALTLEERGRNANPHELRTTAHSDSPQQSTTSSWQPFRVPAAGLAIVARRIGPIRQALTELGITCAPVPNAAAVRNSELAVEATGHVILGDVDQWNAAFGALPKLAERLPVLVTGITPGEWRSLFRGDPMHPALRDTFSRGLLRLPDGRITRVELADGRPIRVQSL